MPQWMKKEKSNTVSKMAAKFKEETPHKWGVFLVDSFGLYIMVEK